MVEIRLGLSEETMEPFVSRVFLWALLLLGGKGRNQARTLECAEWSSSQLRSGQFDSGQTLVPVARDRRLVMWGDHKYAGMERFCTRTWEVKRTKRYTYQRTNYVRLLEFN